MLKYLRNWSAFRWLILPMTTFLLAALVTHQLLRVRRGGEAVQFRKEVNESVKQFATGDKAGALQRLKDASQVAPNDPGPHLDLARKFMGLGQPVLAAGELEKMLRSSGELQTPERFAHLCEFILDQGDVQAAQRVLREDLLARWPNSFEAAFVQGEVLLRETKGQEDVARAAGLFEKCVGLRPEHMPSKIQLGIAWFRLGQLEKAEPLLRAAVRKQPKATVPLYYLGEVLRQEGKTQEAQSYLDEHSRLTQLEQRRRHLELQYALRKCEPQDLLELGRIYEQVGQLDKSASAFRVYTRIMPADPEGQRLLAQACLKIDDKEGARVATELAGALTAAKKAQ